MRLEEAVWLREKILSFPVDRISPMLNIGSSTTEFERRRPYIQRELFEPLIEAGVVIWNVDLKDAPGVEFVGDIGDPVFAGKLKQSGVRSVLCSNLLEHVVDPVRIAIDITSLLDQGGVIFASGPSAFPYHPDPIDNGWRPNATEFANIFGIIRILATEEIAVGSMRRDLREGAALRYFGRLLLPVIKPRKWPAHARRLQWLRRDYTAVACVLEVP